MDVRHVPSVFEPQNTAQGHSLLRSVIHVQYEHHAADQVDQEIASNARTVFLPAAPAGKNVGIEWPLSNVALPCIPIKSLGGKIGRRRIFPCAGGVVAP